MLMHPTVSLHLLHSEGRENSSTRRTFLKFAKEKFVEISIDRHFHEFAVNRSQKSTSF